MTQGFSVLLGVGLFAVFYSIVFYIQYLITKKQRKNRDR